MKLFSVIYNIIFWFIAHLFLIYIILNSECIRDYESFVLDKELKKLEIELKKLEIELKKLEQIELKKLEK